MKRLVAAGCRASSRSASACGPGESGPHHLPEFTMIEWYRAGRPLETLAHDCEALVRAARAAGGARTRSGLGARSSRSGGRPCESCWRCHAGHRARRRRDRRRAARGGARGRDCGWVRPRRGTTSSIQVFLDRIEPALGRDAAHVRVRLARAAGGARAPQARRPAAGRTFELYAGGLELANAFGELTDAVEQRARSRRRRSARGARQDVYPIDEALLAALPTMPPTAGIALGFDRLVMLALGATDIHEVIAFRRKLSAIDRPSETFLLCVSPAGGSPRRP